VHTIRSRPRAAFSLLGLLVVLAIVAILIAILLPAGVLVRRLAIRTACASNLRQLGAATLLYAMDNDLSLPADRNFGDDDPRTSPAWFHRLPPYAGNSSVRSLEVFQCAGFHWRGPQVFTNATPKSYKMNAFLDEDGRPRHYRLGDVQDEGRVVLFADAEAGETGMGQWGDLHPTAVDDSRHRGAVNVLYADGHNQAVVRTPAGTDRHRWEDALRWRSASW
jgi:prepilin-type processing-associated H-X9-DG protein